MPKDLEVMIAVREVDGNSDVASFSSDGSIKSRTSTKEYRDGWEAIFGKVTVDDATDGVKTEKTEQSKPIDKNVN